MRRIALLLAIMVSAIGLGAQTADKLMSEAAAKFAKAGLVEVTFTTTSDNGPVTGMLTMQQRCYTISSPVMSVWYDGNTQWVYSPRSGEVSVTAPTTDELLESNPFMLISNYKQLYKLTKGSGRTVILTPKSPSSGAVRQASITFGADGWPAKIDASFDSGARLIVTINKVTAGQAKPVTAYRFNSKLYPQAEVIDLR